MCAEPRLASPHVGRWRRDVARLPQRSGQPHRKRDCSNCIIASTRFSEHKHDRLQKYRSSDQGMTDIYIKAHAVYRPQPVTASQYHSHVSLDIVEPTITGTKAIERTFSCQKAHPAAMSATAAAISKPKIKACHALRRSLTSYSATNIQEKAGLWTNGHPCRWAKARLAHAATDCDHIRSGRPHRVWTRLHSSAIIQKKHTVSSMILSSQGFVEQSPNWARVK